MYNNIKNILLICPVFYDYHRKIIKTLENQGYSVTFIPERKYTLIDKILKKCSIWLRRKYNNLYLKKEINKLQIEFQYILLIRGEIIDDKTIIHLFERQKQSKKILYLWDSIAENPNPYRFLKYFNKVFSFDIIDCKKFGFNYQPLFYISANIKEKPEKDIDLIFIGLDHSDRYEIVCKIDKYCKEHSIIFKCYLLSTKYKYILRKLSLAAINKDMLIFKQLDSDTVSSLISRSTCVLDIHNPLQSGLTIRTIEILAHGNKLITTNQHIINSEIYSNNNIFVINRNEPIFDINFIKSKSEPKDLSNYTLDKWISNIILS